MQVIECPECNVKVVACDNAVYLDYPAVPYDERKAPWSIFAGKFASVGDMPPSGTGHALHAHQPGESVLA